MIKSKSYVNKENENKNSNNKKNTKNIIKIIATATLIKLNIKKLKLFIIKQIIKITQ